MVGYNTIPPSSISELNYLQCYQVDESYYQHQHYTESGSNLRYVYLSALSLKYKDVPVNAEQAEKLKDAWDSFLYEISSLQRLRDYKDGRKTFLLCNLTAKKSAKAEGFITQKLSKRKPCIIPGLRNLSCSQGVGVAYYILVALYTFADAEAIVGIKDLNQESPATHYVYLSDLLASASAFAKYQTSVYLQSYDILSIE